MTTTPTIWKAAFTPNFEGAAGNQLRPQSIGLANGNILVVWDDNTFGPDSGYDLVGRIFNPLGEAVGLQRQLDGVTDPTHNNQANSKIAALPDGGFVMAFRSYDSTLDQSDGIELQRFDSSGQLIDFMSVSDPTPSGAWGFDNNHWDVAAVPNGDYVLSYTDTTDFAVHARIYNHTTGQPGADQVVTSDDSDFHNLKAIATFSNGNIIYLVEDTDDTGIPFPVRYGTVELRIKTSSGSFVRGGLFEIAGAKDHGADADDVAVLTGGQFVGLYHYTEGAEALALKMGSLTTDGVSVGSEITVASGSFSQISSVVALRDGGFFVAWIESQTVFGTRYSVNGTVIGTPGFTVGTAAASEKDALGQLSLTSDGRILVSYHAANGEIAEVILDPRDNFIDGTSAGEVLTAQTTASSVFGEGGADRIYGLGGDDLLVGGPGGDTVTGGAGGDIIQGGDNADSLYGELGNDSISGDAGDDYLDGGPGNDTLNGGADADTLAGGLDNDTYILSTAHVVSTPDGDTFWSYDTVVENANEGIDSVQVNRISGGAFTTLVKYTLTANVENATVVGTAALGLTGNALDNRLTGNSASNTFTGLGGDDRFVYGPGGGADTITDFVAGAGTPDKIDLTAFIGVHNLGDVRTHATQSAADTVLNFGNGDTLTLKNVVKANLSFDDFLGSRAGISDFNSDSFGDILFRDNSTGDTGYTDVHNSGFHGLGASPTSYSIVGSGDYNGDGFNDILFRDNSTGDTGYTDLHNSGFHSLGASPVSYAVVGSGDYNGDGFSDILFRNNATGDTGYTDLHNNGFHSLGASPVSYAVVGSGDYNGDGFSDILFRNNATGDTGYTDLHNNGFHSLGASPVSYAVVGSGDYNGDGFSDILFRDNATGDTGYTDLHNNGFHSLGASPAAYAVVGSGDYNGDSFSDILFRDNSTGDTGYTDIHNSGFHSLGASPVGYLVIA